MLQLRTSAKSISTFKDRRCLDLTSHIQITKTLIQQHQPRDDQLKTSSVKKGDDSDAQHAKNNPPTQSPQPPTLHHPPLQFHTDRRPVLMIQELLGSQINQTPNIHTTHKNCPQVNFTCWLICVGLCLSLSLYTKPPDDGMMGSRVLGKLWNYVDFAAHAPFKVQSCGWKREILVWIATQVVAAVEAEEWLFSRPSPTHSSFRVLGGGAQSTPPPYQSTVDRIPFHFAFCGISSPNSHYARLEGFGNSKAASQEAAKISSVLPLY